MPLGGPQKAGLSGLFHWAVMAVVLSVVMPAGATAEPIVLEIDSARASYDGRTSEPIVAFTMKPASQRLFADFTAKNVGRKTEIRVDGRLVGSPVIREPIVGGSGQISNKFTAEEARDIAARLSSGRSKLEIEAVD